MQMQTYEYVKLQKRGNMTVPKSLRALLGFKENELVRMSEDNGKLVVEPVKTLTYNVRSYTDEEVEDFFELDAKETKELKTKGLL